MSFVLIVESAGAGKRPAIHELIGENAPCIARGEKGVFN